MVSIHVDIEKLEWKPGSAKYGAVAVHDGKEIIQSAVGGNSGRVRIHTERPKYQQKQ